jgi:hypothetical protein
MLGIKAKLRNLFTLNISEDLYLIGVALVFLILSLTLGLQIWVIHNSFFEDTIWIDIFSSSIFLVLTILLLSWLLKVREQREWNKVKDKVYSNIQSEVNNFFYYLMQLTNKGIPLVAYSLSDIEESAARILFIKRARDSWSKFEKKISEEQT